MVFAGLDTTTSALARCVYLLAQHPDAQARLRSEIRGAMKFSADKEDDDAPSTELPYDILMNLPFLDGVVKETLRLYPSLPLMVRWYVPLIFLHFYPAIKTFHSTTKATILPLHFPVRSRSGALTSAVALPRGTHAIISILAANRHRGMWGADANEWRPERWLSSPTASVPGVKDDIRYPGVYSNM